MQTREPACTRQVLEREARQLVAAASADEEVLYVDEVDIHLNPRIGLMYIQPGHPPLVLTPGQNEKRGLAAILNPRTGTVLYACSDRKTPTCSSLARRGLPSYLR